ncbi:MAG: DinB family protein [Acidobacteria bacterium]|nr:DinB family protein [Acidobacteriota bacterium]
MTNQEFFLKRWHGEQRAFREVLQAVPGEHLDYAPHQRSTKAGDLAWQIALEQETLVGMLDTGELRFDLKPRPFAAGEIVAAYERASEDLRKHLERNDEARWNRPVKFLMGGQEIGNDTVQNFMWGFLFDMVHHRGQLAAYLRPMGAKVPAIYGPSGDSEPGS